MRIQAGLAYLGEIARYEAGCSEQTMRLDIFSHPSQAHRKPERSWIPTSVPITPMQATAGTLVEDILLAGPLDEITSLVYRSQGPKLFGSMLWYSSCCAVRCEEYRGTLLRDGENKVTDFRSGAAAERKWDAKMIDGIRPSHRHYPHQQEERHSTFNFTTSFPSHSVSSQSSISARLAAIMLSRVPLAATIALRGTLGLWRCRSLGLTVSQPNLRTRSYHSARFNQPGYQLHHRIQQNLQCRSRVSLKEGRQRPIFLLKSGRRYLCRAKKERKDWCNMRCTLRLAVKIVRFR